MFYDLTKLTETELLTIFHAIVAQDGPFTVSDLKELAELDIEMNRRLARNAAQMEEAARSEENDIQFRVGGQA